MTRPVKPPSPIVEELTEEAGEATPSPLPEVEVIIEEPSDLTKLEAEEKADIEPTKEVRFLQWFSIL